MSPDTLERFARRFAPYGFRREALHARLRPGRELGGPLLPAAGPRRRASTAWRARPFEREGRAAPARPGDERALRFVSVGAPLPGARGADRGRRRRRAAPSGRVGRLVFRGPSMTSGYYRQPEATAAITLAGGWLDSGDLAYRADGEIYIAGRRKDLIIKGGPQPASRRRSRRWRPSVDGIRKGCVVAFGVDHAEPGHREPGGGGRDPRAATRPSASAIAAAVIDRVAAALGVPPDEVALVPPGAVPEDLERQDPPRGRRASCTARARSAAPRRTPAAARACALARGAARRRPRLRARAARALRGLPGAVALVLVAALSGWPWPSLPRARGGLRRSRRFGARLLLRARRLPARPSRARAPARRGPVRARRPTTPSYVDVPALVALLPLDFLFVAKKEVLSWPLVRPLVRKRRPPDRGPLRRAAERGRRRAGRRAPSRRATRVLFFPEGTFTARGGPAAVPAGRLQDRGGGRRAGGAPRAAAARARVLRDGGVAAPARARSGSGSARRCAAEGDGWRAVVALRDRVADADRRALRRAAARPGGRRPGAPVSAAARLTLDDVVRARRVVSPPPAPHAAAPLVRAAAAARVAEARVLAAHRLVQGAGRH